MKELEHWSGDPAELEAWTRASIRDLVRHIVERYHREARIEMARLETQAEEAVLLEGRNDPVLLEIRDEVGKFCDELRAHLQHEERNIFPALLDLAEERKQGTPPGLLEPLRLLQSEHESAAGLLKRLRKLTGGFVPPEGAKAVQKSLYESFDLLADSLHRHIYLENQVLFKRVLHNR